MTLFQNKNLSAVLSELDADQLDYILQRALQSLYSNLNANFDNNTTTSAPEYLANLYDALCAICPDRIDTNSDLWLCWTKKQQVLVTEYAVCAAVMIAPVGFDKATLGIGNCPDLDKDECRQRFEHLAKQLITESKNQKMQLAGNIGLCLLGAIAMAATFAIIAGLMAATIVATNGFLVVPAIAVILIICRGVMCAINSRQSSSEYPNLYAAGNYGLLFTRSLDRQQPTTLPQPSAPKLSQI